MTLVRRVMAMMIAVSVFAACSSGDSSGDGETTTVTSADMPTESLTPSAPVGGDPILIETRVTNARLHTGKVLNGSFIGESAFCPGGKSSGGSVGATITTTFHCADGTLVVEFAPTQFSLIQGAAWTIVSGTESFKGLHGGGSMVAKFDSDDPEIGGEVFTGLVSN